jgi:amino acid adenylation domain-containing protein
VTATAPQHTEHFYQRFREIVAHRPAKPALITVEGTTLSYASLGRLADQTATQIAEERGAGHDCLVVEAPRSPAHLAALLAAWRCGLAYVPLRAHEPSVRRAQVLGQLAERALLASGDGASVRVSRLGTGDRQTGQLGWAAGEVAYLAFTSGSTGRPKAAVLPVTALANRVDWSQRAYPLRPDDVLLQHTAMSFDFAVWEMLASLLHGSTLLLAPDEPQTDFDSVLELAAARGVTVAHFVPSVLSLLTAAGQWPQWPSLRLLYSGGEQLTGVLARRVQASTPALLVNQYGPAETCVDSTHYACAQAPEDGPVPIGRPIDNTECRVVDDELVIGGAGVALGYLDPASDTDGRFTASEASRWFRTGDLVTVAADGNLVFTGRADDQVKVGGVRLELAELESAALSFPGVSAAVAMVETRRGVTAVDLVAECRGAGLRVAELRAHLADRLAGPVMPRSVQVVPSVPRLASGKVDRRRVRLVARRKEDG